jgi:hypothetical protein
MSGYRRLHCTVLYGDSSQTQAVMLTTMYRVAESERPYPYDNTLDASSLHNRPILLVASQQAVARPDISFDN